MNHIYNNKKLAPNYIKLSKDSLIYINTFGEPFFKNENDLYKISLETADVEIVDTSIEEDYWTGLSLRKKWEERNGEVGSNYFLVPIIPFVLGGEFVIENLMKLEIKTALDYYEDIRSKVSGLEDGTEISIQVKP